MQLMLFNHFSLFLLSVTLSVSYSVKLNLKSSFSSVLGSKLISMRANGIAVVAYNEF